MAAEKLLNDIKVLDDKINKKHQELETLTDKREKCKAKLIGTLMEDNNLTIDEVVDLFQGSTASDDTKVHSIDKEIKNG